MMYNPKFVGSIIYKLLFNVLSLKKRFAAKSIALNPPLLNKLMSLYLQSDTGRMASPKWR